MIKTKQDAQNTLNNIKTGNTLTYETDNSITTILYNNETEKFIKESESIIFLNPIKSKSEYSEHAILEQIFLDRKFINKILK